MPEELEEKIMELTNELVSAREREKQLRSERGDTFENKEAATKELKSKLAEVERPFNARMSELDEQISKTSDLVYKIPFRITDVQNQMLVRDAVKTGWDNDSILALGYLWGVRDSRGRTTGKPIKYDNGITILSVHEADWSAVWFAVYDGKVIGITARRKAEHIADLTTPFAWIGVSELSAANTLKLCVPKEVKSGYGKTQRFNIGYREWAYRIKEITNPSELPEILPTPENVQAIRKAREE